MRDKLKKGLTIVAEGAEASADNGATLAAVPNRRLSGVFGAAIIVQSDVSGMNHGRSANDIDAGSDETRTSPV